ncbi:MAG: hypothetical protein QF385_06220 [SAR324 cluster bacterium]|nr:hypothetical protein [SAR324 cluster bacterium]
MNHSERNRELLKKVQQKAEALRETWDSNDQFETELEAVQEVYGLSDSEMKRITEEAAREVDSEDQHQSNKMEFSLPERSLGLTVSTIMLVIAGLILIMVTPIIGALFLGGIFIFRLHR